MDVDTIYSKEEITVTEMAFLLSTDRANVQPKIEKGLIPAQMKYSEDQHRDMYFIKTIDAYNYILARRKNLVNQINKLRLPNNGLQED